MNKKLVYVGFVAVFIIVIFINNALINKDREFKILNPADGKVPKIALVAADSSVSLPDTNIQNQVGLENSKFSKITKFPENDIPKYVSNDKGEIYARFPVSEKIYKLENMDFIPLEGGHRFKSIKYVGNDWYAVADCTKLDDRNYLPVNDCLLYKVTGTKLNHIDEIEKSVSIRVVGTTSIAYVLTSKNAPGMCGDFGSFCNQGDIYSIKNNKIEKIIENTPKEESSEYETLFIDVRGYAYLMTGKEVFVLKDEKVIGIVAKPFYETSFYSDINNTYVYDAYKPETIYKIVI